MLSYNNLVVTIKWHSWIIVQRHRLGITATNLLSYSPRVSTLAAFSINRFFWLKSIVSSLFSLWVLTSVPSTTVGLTALSVGLESWQQTSVSRSDCIVLTPKTTSHMSLSFFPRDRLFVTTFSLPNIWPAVLLRALCPSSWFSPGIFCWFLSVVVACDQSQSRIVDQVYTISIGLLPKWLLKILFRRLSTFVWQLLKRGRNIPEFCCSVWAPPLFTDHRLLWIP